MISSPQGPRGVRRQPGEAGGRPARSATHRFGKSCLLAARLIEAGVRFVTVSFGGWDTHVSNFRPAKDKLLPQLDEGLAGAVHDAGGQAACSTRRPSCVTGEFGRTPKINERAGRDHWPRAMCVLLAGGGIKGGQVHRRQRRQGHGPGRRPATRPTRWPPRSTTRLGIDHRKEYHTATGRPVMIVRDGSVIPRTVRVAGERGASSPLKP